MKLSQLLKPYKDKVAQSGTAGAWIYAMITLFAMVILYSVFSLVIEPIHSSVRTEMVATNSSGLDVLDVIMTGWNNWILVMVFGIILFVIVRAVAFERI